jgi:hypothetical protein
MRSANSWNRFEHTFLAEGVMLPGNTMMPRSIAFSSKIVSSLKKRSSLVDNACRIDNSLPHCFDTNTPLIRKKHEDLISRVCTRVGEEIELIPANIVVASNQRRKGTYRYILTLRCRHCWRSGPGKWPGPFEFRRQKLRSPGLKSRVVRSSFD